MRTNITTLKKKDPLTIIGASVVATVVFLLVAILPALISGWALMLLTGIFYLNVSSVFPLLGFWTSVAITYLSAVVVQFVSGKSTEASSKKS